MSHHIRFFRFNHKTNIEVASGTEADLSIDEFFSHQPSSAPNDDDDEHYLLAG